MSRLNYSFIRFSENQNKLSESSKSNTHSALSKPDGQSSTNVSEQSSAVSAQVNETDSDRTGPKLQVVVSPTRDSNSECHEKPWIKAGDRALSPRDAGDQTFIKQ